ncbi:MAG: LysM peptidoglycan-binding domain-containing protein [Lachnospiraceae bacterium]|jgi:cell division protein YceG involved in septum cleavage|nr:LysM peptidoglycan-binding domain-containing protein [Lachnospiraceae bacterium]
MNKSRFIKNRRAVNNNIIMLTILAFVLIFGIGHIAYANSSAKNSYEKTYISYEIKEGDSLCSVADQFKLPGVKSQEFITEVKTINNLKNDTIHTGCYLIIPVYTLQ